MLMKFKIPVTVAQNIFSYNRQFAKLKNQEKAIYEWYQKQLDHNLDKFKTLNGAENTEAFSLMEDIQKEPTLSKFDVDKMEENLTIALNQVQDFLSEREDK